MLRRKRPNERVSPDAGALSPPVVDELSRVSSLVKLSLAQLQPLAELPDDASANTVVQFTCEKLGGPEPVSMMLRLCDLSVEEDRLDAQALQQLKSDAVIYFDGLQNSALNMTVIYSLLLTIYVTLSVMAAGTSAYVTPLPDAASHHYVFGEDEDAWADLAQWCWPDDVGARAALRRSAYVGECVINAVGALVCLVGMWEANFLYLSFGQGLPDVLTKVEYLFGRKDRVLSLWGFFDASLMGVPLSLVFISARCSGIAFCCACGVAVLDILYFVRVVCIKGGCCADMYVMQMREAKRSLAAVASRRQEIRNGASGSAESGS